MSPNTIRESAPWGIEANAIHSLLTQLIDNGIAILPNLLTARQLHGMQASFGARLKRMRWNNFDGYEKTERYRHLVQDVLTLDQGFVDVALNPAVIEVLRQYIGGGFELVEAKGWKSLPTRRDFNGWHGDAWYDQNLVPDRVPREVKLGIYLTDVRSGGFVYVKGTHGRQHPKPLDRAEVCGISQSRAVEVTGPAGLGFLFDTSGFHRQNVPIVEPREAVFFAYHDPRIPLQKEDVDYYRYHPLMLNAAFLGQLSEEERRIFGFGNKINFQPLYERSPAHTTFQTVVRTVFGVKLVLAELRERIEAKIRRLIGQQE
jgi:hypothetical protein